jgi:hypothetical protein
MLFRQEPDVTVIDHGQEPCRPETTLRRASELYRSAGEEADALLRAFESQPLDRLLERDDFSSNRHPALASYLSMIFPENRFPLFGIML